MFSAPLYRIRLFAVGKRLDQAFRESFWMGAPISVKKWLGRKLPFSRKAARPEPAKTLTAVSYDEQYYREHAEAGLDYLKHGYWHQSYAAMVTESTFQSTYSDPFIIDAGCACGSILKGFRDLAVYKRVLGIDLSEHMIELGRKHFGYAEDELMAGSMVNLPVESETVSLLHSAQVLEHVPDEFIDPALDEFARVLRSGGRAFLCLDAMRDGEAKEIYMGDPTHVNIQPVLYWTEKFQKRGLLFDIEAFNRFARSRRGPTAGDPRSFFEIYPYWSAWTLIKI
jgi:ubiquinone/menaquinone biosynthesis C-methylase UbiE